MNEGKRRGSAVKNLTAAMLASQFSMCVGGGFGKVGGGGVGVGYFLEQHIQQIL